MSDTTTVTVVRRETAHGLDQPSAQLVVSFVAASPAVSPSRHLLQAVDVVLLGRARGSAGSAWDRDRKGGHRRLLLWLPDPGMSKEHARLLRVHGRWVLEDLGSKNGTLVNGAPVSRAVLQDSDLIELGSTFLRFCDSRPPVAGADDVSADGLAAPLPGLRTFVASLARGFGELASVAVSDLPILILGPTGSGKEVAAAAAHELSGRRGAFVPVNCGALSPALVEAELFGHRRGAFSGAIEDRDGFVRAADRGTLFLDEIAELPPASQVALLRVLQEREVTPVGTARPIKVDVRVIAATHRDLPARVADGTFREDLFARLDGFTLRLPPLAERREDLGLLAATLLARARTDTSLAPEATRALFVYAWPHNVRELDLALQTASALAKGRPIQLADLPGPVRASLAELPTSGRAQALDPDDARVRAELVQALTDHAGNLSAVARAMGKGRTQIHRWLARFAIDPARFRR